MTRITLSPDQVQAIYEKLESIEKKLRNQVPTTDDAILTTEEVMNFLSVSRRSLQGWRDSSLIEYSAINGKFYYRMSSINKMLNKHLVNPVC